MTPMIHRRCAEAARLLATAALLALAVAPIGAAVQSGGARGGATPAVDTRHARVIVKYKGDGALMRESTLGARDPDRVAVQHAGRMSQRLGIALRDGHVVAPRTQVLHARNLSSAELVARLQADPDVEYAEVDERVRFAAAPNDPRYAGGQTSITPAAGQWYLRAPDSTIISAINAEAAWDITQGSSSIIVAVLDTGVRPDHPDLVGKLVGGYDFVSADPDGSFASANDGNGRDADPSDPGDWVTSAESQLVGGPLEGCEPGDSSWHGTQTAALIGAATNDGVGMASVGRNVRVMPVRVLGKCGGFMSDVVAAMYWAAGIPIPASPSSLGTAPTNPNPAKVLNLSLGSPTTTCGPTYQAAVTAVIGAGASVVVSAGNDAGLAVGQPANCAGAIGVGGLRHIGTKVGFSDVGPQISISAPGGNCVTLAGTCQFPILTATNSGVTTPAGNTYTDGGANASVGTSFSAPLVSGTLGLMLSMNPGLSPSQLRVGVMKTSRAFPASGAGAGVPVCHAPDTNIQDECYCTETTCGAGMLNAAGAAAAVASLKAWVTAPSSQVAVGSTVTLDGSASWAAPGQSIATRVWSLEPAAGPASLQVSGDQLTATVLGVNAGTVVVRLTITDGQGSSQADTTLSVGAATAGGGGDSGGGVLTWPWLLGLCLAVAALRRPRRQ